MKLSEAAYGGAEYIAEHGHHKGSMFDNEDDHGRAVEEGRAACMLGSIKGYLIGTKRMTFWDASDIMWAVGYKAETNITRFNDHPSTTAEDAILKLKEIGHALEEKGL